MDGSTIRVDRDVSLDARKLQLRIEEAEGTKPTLSDVLRRALDVFAKALNAGSSHGV